MNATQEKQQVQMIRLRPAFVENGDAREAYWTLRTNFLAQVGEKQVIAFTAFTAGNEKSAMVLTLGRDLSLLGKRVLVIDADMRRSAIAAQFGTSERRNGLSQYLSGQIEIGAAVAATQYAGLFLLMCGYYPPNPVELLENERFSDLLAAARKVYDYVLIDCPLMNGMIDAAVIAQNSDGVVPVIAEGVDRIHAVYAGRQQLERVGCSLVGAVLIGRKRHVLFGNRGSYGTVDQTKG